MNLENQAAQVTVGEWDAAQARISELEAQAERYEEVLQNAIKIREGLESGAAKLVKRLTVMEDVDPIAEPVVYITEQLVKDLRAYLSPSDGT